ncbi:splicing factor [Dimargaris verticillata]|uniref:Splicing factor n=1 Tax=Dimargaris verticillata TaxID=2761393 RepID=A0A9W8B605_9FUNG|nr:splicing factor [Dimargaris verticillata]
MTVEQASTAPRSPSGTLEPPQATSECLTQPSAPTSASTRSAGSNRMRSDSRSRSRSRHRTRRRDRRHSDRRESYHHRRRHRSRSHDRHHRRHHSPSPPLDPRERDLRTVMVMQLAQNLRDRDLYKFFSRAGPVRTARIVHNRRSMRTRGVGYVEFCGTEAIPNALALSGERLLGVPILVDHSGAEKNQVPSKTTRPRSSSRQPQTQPDQPAARVAEKVESRLYVGNLDPNLKESDLEQLFLTVGPVELVDIIRDATSTLTTRYGFVQYATVDLATQAQQMFNGLELVGRPLKVQFAHPRNRVTAGDGAALANAALAAVSATPGMFATAPELQSPSPTPRSHTSSPRVPSPGAQKGSRMALLQHMFDPAAEAQPDWVDTLKADITNECSKYGLVESVWVDTNTKGDILVEFATEDAAHRAIEALQGRGFAGNEIAASSVSHSEVARRSL